MKRAVASGFTLIEMMIVITIIAVLAAIALPNYQGYLTRTACEDAKGVLAGAASSLERFRAQNNRYLPAGEGIADTNDRLAVWGYDQSPVDGNAQFDIVLTAVTATTYTLTATPIAGGRLAGRGTLTLESTGARGATGDLANPTGAAPPVSVWENNCRGL